MSMQLCLFSQRWRDRRESYRPTGEVINPRLYEVAELAGDREAKAFILAHDYSVSYPSARFRFGLFTRGCLVGVAVFSHPCNDRVLTSVFPLSPLDSVELGRFVLLDSVPANGESWFLARTFECLRRKGFAGVVSFSDPVPADEGGRHDRTPRTHWDLLPGDFGNIPRQNRATNHPAV